MDDEHERETNIAAAADDQAAKKNKTVMIVQLLQVRVDHPMSWGWKTMHNHSMIHKRVRVNHPMWSEVKHHPPLPIGNLSDNT